MFEPNPPTTLDFDSIIRTGSSEPGNVDATIQITTQYHWGPHDRVAEVFMGQYHNETQVPEQISVGRHQIVGDTVLVPLTLRDNATYEITTVVHSNDTLLGALFQRSTYVVVQNTQPSLLSPSTLKQAENTARLHKIQEYPTLVKRDDQIPPSPQDGVSLQLDITATYQPTSGPLAIVPLATYTIYYQSGTTWLPGPTSTLDENGVDTTSFTFNIKPSSTVPIRIDIALLWNDPATSVFQLSPHASAPRTNVAPYT